MAYGIGCNYWDSQSGTEMWRRFDERVVDEDFRRLAEYGVEYLRVFPNWRDFQPVMSIKTYRGAHREYCFADERPLDNEFGLDYGMLERFAVLCRLAEKHHIRLIVSIVTGWMSGRLFVPPALEGKNVITDSEALLWQEKYVRGFVRFLKGQASIAAWDLGNECNCMGKADTRAQAYVWSAVIRNAVRAEDPTRRILSGMHDLSPYDDGIWNLQDQGSLTDGLTPHPYNTSYNGGETDPMNRLRTTYLSAFEVQLYAGIGGKPAMIQELGGLNQVYGTGTVQADFLRVTMLSAWSAGAEGYLWWCAFDQQNLEFSPYSYSMRELGLLDTQRRPKPQALEMKKIRDALRALPFEDLPPREIDAVCVLSILKDWRPVAANTALLAKQAGIEVVFRNYRQDLPKANMYFLPCIEGWNVTTKANFSALLERVREGAVLYVSYHGGVLEDFERVFGLQSQGLRTAAKPRCAGFALEGETVRLSVEGEKELLLSPAGAVVLAADENQNPLFTKHGYGKGWVYFMNAPLERMLWNKPGAFCEDAPPYYKIYREMAAGILADKPVVSENSQIGLTWHPIDGNHAAVVAINYSDKPQQAKLNIQPGWRLTCVYGGQAELAACDGAVYLAQREEEQDAGASTAP